MAPTCKPFEKVQTKYGKLRNYFWPLMSNHIFHLVTIQTAIANGCNFSCWEIWKRKYAKLYNDDNNIVSSGKNNNNTYLQIDGKQN